MLKFVAPQVAGGEIGRVLDYGGDKGQFIPEGLGTEKFVFELSQAQPVSGVSRIASEADLAGKKFDLALLLGVLEHCSSPLEIIKNLKRLLKGPHSYLVMSVPHERYNVDAVGKGSLYIAYLDLLLKNKPLLKAVDLYSTIARVKSNRIPPFGILKCHEHLNFFNELSLTKLLNRAGMDLVSLEVVQMCSYPDRVYSLNMIARPMSSDIYNNQAAQES